MFKPPLDRFRLRRRRPRPGPPVTHLEDRLGRRSQGLLARLKHRLIGRPLATAELPHELLPKLTALPVFASDAVSSVAYATEEMLLVLALAGSAAFTLDLPIALAITALLAIVAVSYMQTIPHYPQGGGTYLVTKDNLGAGPALVAGAALLIDYVMTVAVSISSGIAALVSAVPVLGPLHVELALVALGLIAIANLRGVRESAAVFTLPTYAFILGIYALIACGAWHVMAGVPLVQPVASKVPSAVEPVSLMLVLRAFSSGCSALTGTEAVSNGIPAFREPQIRNARTTLAWMACILGSMFLGITLLAHHFQVLPHADETLISQLARGVFGRGLVYYFVQTTTLLILVLAANTSFADFPRLSNFMARDGYMPEQFSYRGDRLAYSSGIIVLTLVSAVLIAAFRASTDALIPLYAIGVFVAFTFSQASMTYRWWRRREPGWQRGIVINAVGALATGVVSVIVAVSKFTSGAWMVLVALPLLVLLQWATHRHYEEVEAVLCVPPGERRIQAAPPPSAVVIVKRLDRSALAAIDYVLALSTSVTVLHVTFDTGERERFEQEWNQLRVPEGVSLVILNSPYRSLIGPIVDYLKGLEAEHLLVAVTEPIPRHWWEFVLHNQTTLWLKLVLFVTPKVGLMDIPYHLKPEGK